MYLPEEQAAHYHFTTMEFIELLEKYGLEQILSDYPELEKLLCY